MIRRQMPGLPPGSDARADRPPHSFSLLVRSRTRAPDGPGSGVDGGPSSANHYRQMAARRRFVGVLPRGPSAIFWLCGVILLGPGAAQAEHPPKIKGEPVITGVPQEGATLTASASWKADPPSSVAWSWLRCDESGEHCDAIPDVNGATYVPMSADIGTRLRVRVTWTEGDKSDGKHSAPSDVVLAAPTASPTTPPPTPAPSPAPDQSSFDPPPAASAQPLKPRRGAQPRPAERLQVLHPFPVVRIRGWLTARGARITLLTVRAPRGTRITVLCHGRSCPLPTLARTASVSRLRPFEREFPAGTRLDFTVTRPGAIGKWTQIVIRRGAPPRRRDGCLNSDTLRYRRCPRA
jgi:hypothetical protein